MSDVCIKVEKLPRSYHGEILREVNHGKILRDFHHYLIDIMGAFYATCKNNLCNMLVPYIGRFYARTLTLHNTFPCKENHHSDLCTVLKCQEGTTQGDPLAMPMYAMATIPLIKRPSKSVLHAVMVCR